MKFSQSKILVLGAGISGMAVAAILRQIGAQVTLSDARTADQLNKDFSKLIAAGVNLELGGQQENLLCNRDYLVLSPGISIYNPLIKKAQQQGITVMSEIEVAYQLCLAPILAITGTNGKTTTTTLVGEMLKAADKEVVVGGNIGQALTQEVAGISSNGVVVAEISSFQLEGVLEFRPHIAALLNITPDHLDRHHSMDNYIAMKERIFARQLPEDVAVLNYDDELVRRMAERISSRVVFFSRKEELASGVIIRDGIITVCQDGQSQAICPISNIQLKGSHNVENVLAACAIAFFAGVSPAIIAEVISGFKGVEHRIELVDFINGVGYYNDSKATNPESTIKAVEAFSGGIILIAGGRDKNTDLSELMELVRERVDQLIVLGEAQERFYQAAEQHGVKSVRRAASMAEAVSIAHSSAQAPQVVLLSPACASYDMFDNYEQRGSVFKQLVHQLR